MARSARPSYGREGYDATLDRPHVLAPAAVRRISWGAIIAGISVVLVLQLLLTLLGLAVGASTIDPAAADTPQPSTVGMGAGIWWVVSTSISVFAGAWVAGRLAGMPTRVDGMLHGVVTWAAATLLAFYLLTTTVGSLIGGAFGALGTVAQTVGQSTQSQAQGAMLVLPDEIRTQAERLFERAPAAAGQVQQQTNQAVQAAGGGTMLDAVQRVIRGVQEGASPQDRDAAVNVIAQQAGIPREQAQQRLDQFQEAYRTYSAQAAEQARQAADAAAQTVSQVSFWSVVALVIGAVLAGLGGSLGTPRDLRAPI
jgi:ElaB/YqjD/DUF883 family membrane-anchored ribosome-binding protein